MNKKTSCIITMILSALISIVALGYVLYEFFDWGGKLDFTHIGTNLSIIIFLFSFYILVICINLLTVKNSSNTNDELLKYKALLNEEIITQEEFDEKKKELLCFSDKRKKESFLKRNVLAIVSLIVIITISTTLYLNIFSEFTGIITNMTDNFVSYDTVTIKTETKKHTVKIKDYKEFDLKIGDTVKVKSISTWDYSHRAITIKKVQ